MKNLGLSPTSHSFFRGFAEMVIGLLYAGGTQYMEWRYVPSRRRIQRSTGELRRESVGVVLETSDIVAYLAASLPGLSSSPSRLSRYPSFRGV